MHVFDVLGDPVRRRILELLAGGGEQPSGAVGAVIRAEFGISQPAVSQHLRVLRETGLASVRAEGARRLYAVEAAPLREADLWLEGFRGIREARETREAAAAPGAPQRPGAPGAGGPAPRGGSTRGGSTRGGTTSRGQHRASARSGNERDHRPDR